MFIVYSGKQKILAEESINVTCPACNATDSIRMKVVQEYLTVFWIPVFPYGKKPEAICSSCNSGFTLNRMPEDMKYEYKRIAVQNKTPIWTFSGIGIILLLILVAVTININASAQHKEYIQTPKVNDIYEYKIAPGRYSLMKVVDVTGGTVTAIPCKYETNKISGLDDLRYRGNEAFDDTVFAQVTIRRLDSMLEEGEILSVIR